LLKKKRRDDATARCLPARRRFFSFLKQISAASRRQARAPFLLISQVKLMHADGKQASCKLQAIISKVKLGQVAGA
jgi:hypothetical protein